MVPPGKLRQIGTPGMMTKRTGRMRGIARRAALLLALTLAPVAIHSSGAQDAGATPKQDRPAAADRVRPPMTRPPA